MPGGFVFMATNSQQIERDLIGKRLDRSFVIDRAERQDAADDDNRTVSLSFASDTPHEHFLWSIWDFADISLSLEKGAMRTERLENSAPLLMDHNSRDQIGVIESFSIDKAEGVVRADVRFSRSQRGEEIYRDVLDGIRKNVSVGAQIHTLTLIEKKQDGNDLYRADDWEPLEISIVSIPQDIGVGIGRSLEPEPAGSLPVSRQENPQKEEIKMSEQQTTPVTPATEPQVAVPAITRVRGEINEWAETLTRGAEAAKQYFDDVFRNGEEPTMSGFRQFYRSFQPASATPVTVEPAAVTAQRQGAGTSALTVGRDVRSTKLVAFRGDNGREEAYRSGQFLRAVFFRDEKAQAFCRDNGIAIERVHSESNNESGGYLVPIEFENSIIDLQLEYGVFRRNANVVSMSSNSLQRPRRKNGLVAYPIGAVGASRQMTRSKLGWNLVGLNAKMFGVLAKYEDELGEDAIISFADTIARESAQAFAQIEDECGFIGDGTGDYHGITGVIPAITGLDVTPGNIAGVHVAAGGDEWKDLVINDILAVIGKLPSFARGSVKWYCTREFWASVLCRLAITQGGSARSDVENALSPRFFGYPVEFVEVMPHAQAASQIPLLFGALDLAAMFGDRRGITVKMTDSNDDDFENNLISVRATERFDINVHDVGNASANAADRQAGPIVALMMGT